MPIPLDLSFSKTLTLHHPLFITTKPSPPMAPTLIIRMGGGPRTYPGGVSKWQWKRMQAKKSKQLLKARLARERQIYEMRKRAELKAAVSELERPWEIVEKGPNLFSVSADEQVKVLADRFQKGSGFDLWSENDGPQLFKTFEGVPSARFFPKGVVHSVKPYGSVSGLEELDDESASDEDDGRLGLENVDGMSTRRIRGGELGFESGIDEDDGEFVPENEQEMSTGRIRGGQLGLKNEDGMGMGRVRWRGRRGSFRSGGKGGLERNGSAMRRVAGTNGDSGFGRGIDEDGELGWENEMCAGRIRGRGRRGSVRSGGVDGLENGSGVRRIVGQSGGRRNLRSNSDGRMGRSEGRARLEDSKFESGTDEDGELGSGNKDKMSTRRMSGKGRRWGNFRSGGEGGLERNMSGMRRISARGGGRRSFGRNGDGRMGRNEGWTRLRDSKFESGTDEDGELCSGNENQLSMRNIRGRGRILDGGTRNLRSNRDGRMGRSDDAISKLGGSKSEVFDLNLQQDGSYGF